MSQPLTQAKRDARAHAIYEKITRHSERWGILIALAILLVSAAATRKFGIQFGDFWFYFVLGGCWLGFRPLLHLFAKRAVINAGWPHETRRETEIVRRTTANVAGSWIEDSREENLTSRFIWAIFCCGAGVVLWFKSGEAQSQMLAILYGLGVALCVVCLIWHLFNSHLPTLRVDERGIFGYVYVLFPRLFLWEDIREVHFVRCYDPLKDRKSVTVRLKDAGGKEPFRFELAAERKAEQARAEQFIEQIKLRLVGKL